MDDRLREAAWRTYYHRYVIPGYNTDDTVRSAFIGGWTAALAASARFAAPVAPEGPCPVHGDGCAPFCEGMRPVEELGSCVACGATVDVCGGSLSETYCCGGCRHPVAASVAQDSPDPLREALHACVDELDRLWYLHGRPGATFEGKVGEPDQQVIARGRAALAGVAQDSPDPLTILRDARAAIARHCPEGPGTDGLLADIDAAIEGVSRDPEPPLRTKFRGG